MKSTGGPTGELVLVVGLFNNGKPQVFTNVGLTAHTIEEGIDLAIQHFRMNYPQVKNPQYRAYNAKDPDGSEHTLIEVYDGRGDMVFTGLYKVIAGKYQWAGS